MITFLDDTPVYANCLVCGYGVTINFNSFCGTIDMNIECDHTKKPTAISTTTSYKIVAKLYIITLILVSYLICIPTYYGPYLKNGIDSIAYVLEIIYYIISALVYGGGLKYKKTHERLLVTFVENIERQAYVGGDPIFPKRTIAFLRYIWMIFNAIMSFVLFLPIGYLMVLSEFTVISTHQAIAQTLGIYYECGFGFVVLFYVSAHYHWLNAVLYNIKTTLASKLEPNKPNPYENWNLKCCLRSYLIFVESFDFLNSAGSAWYFIYFVHYTINLILNIYIILKALFDGIDIWDTPVDLYVTRWRILVTVFVQMLFLVPLQKISVNISNVQSYLLTFPISKLSPLEAAQIECLVVLLEIRKPVVRAAEIFIIRFSVLVPVLSTVITYVLVAIQFNPSWAKE